MLFQDRHLSVIIDTINKKESKPVNSTFQPTCHHHHLLSLNFVFTHSANGPNSSPQRQPGINVRAGLSRMGRCSNTVVCIVERDELRLEHDVAEDLDTSACTRLNGPEAVYSSGISIC